MEILTDIQGLQRAITRDLGFMTSYAEYRHTDGNVHVMVVVMASDEDHLIYQGSNQPHGAVKCFPVLRDELADYLANGRKEAA